MVPRPMTPMRSVRPCRVAMSGVCHCGSHVSTATVGLTLALAPGYRIPSPRENAVNLNTWTVRGIALVACVLATLAACDKGKKDNGGGGTGSGGSGGGAAPSGGTIVIGHFASMTGP